jgi:predicted alpha-1,2-mannosidase
MKRTQPLHKTLLRLSLVFCLSSFVFCPDSHAQTNYAKLVNPFIGTGGHGHTYPGATMPHGMVQLSPDTRLEGWDGCGGYHYSDNYIYGFSHTHLSGTGIPDYCDILVMPMAGKPSPDNKVYGSSFSHANEKAYAGYYSVLLDNGNIQTEFTATERTGFHHYTFSGQNDNTIILDLKHRDEVLESSLKLEDSFTVSGMRRSKSWAENQYVFFVMKFSKLIKHFGVWNNDAMTDQHFGDAISSKNLKAFFQFDLTADKDVYVKVALSPTGVEGAKRNLTAELPGWDFEKVKAEGEKKWNAELSKIEVTGNEEKKKIFYTALYHTAVVPCVNMDVDGAYRGMDNNIHKAEGFTYYSVFSLWDTYRAANPLYTIIDRKRTSDYIKTFLTHYKEGGRLPVWELASNETNCMIGYHSIPVIVDAYVKGIRDFDVNLALEAMLHSANADEFGLKYYRSKGLIESDDEQESTSRTLEYSYDDWCIATFAKAIGNEKVYNEFIKRAQYYKNVLDPKTGNMRPRKNGDWLSPFDPREVNNNFTEANSWQYSFCFTQDINGYLNMTGGKDSLEKKLDRLFSTSPKTTGREQSDITGLIGQYAQGNEPSHHIAYLYNYTNAPWKTQKIVHQIMTDFYKNDPDGLIGNEDCGQMSAWYVLSAMGLYQVTPGTDYFNIGTPEFDNIKVRSELSGSFEISAKRENNQSFYLSGINFFPPLADIKHTTENLCLNYKDMQPGARLQLFMESQKGSSSLKSFATTNISAGSFVVNPVIQGGTMSFQNSRQVPITVNQKGVKIFYTTDGTEPTNKSTLYTKPLNVDYSQTVKAIAYDAAGNSSFVTTAVYKKMEHDWAVKTNTAYEQMYDGGGAIGLVDGIRGETNWRKGNWQGYQKTDVDVTIDLKKATTISSVSAGFLQDTRAWIVMPKEVIVEVSNDGKTFTQVSDKKGLLPIEELTPQLKTAEATFTPVKARFVRLKAIQYGKLPSWHESPGGDTHIFMDEIEIK